MFQDEVESQNLKRQKRHLGTSVKDYLIRMLAGEMTNQIILTRPPLQPLVVGSDRYVKTLYKVVKAADTSKDVFMLSEMTPNDQMTNKVTCINYDDRYYQQDHDFI